MTDDNGDQPAGPTRGRHYDWDRIHSEYIEGIDVDGRLTWPTLEEVARRNNAYPGNVRTRSMNEGWVEQRTLFQRRVEIQRQEERSTQLAELGAGLDVSALRIARSGLAIVSARLQEFATMATTRARAIQDDDRDKTAALPPAPMTDEVARLARAATDWYDIGAKALGDTAQHTVWVGGVPGAPIEHDHAVDLVARTEGILGILLGAGALEQRDGDDAGPRLALAALNGGSAEAGRADDTSDDEVRPEDADPLE